MSTIYVFEFVIELYKKRYYRGYKITRYPFTEFNSIRVVFNNSFIINYLYLKRMLKKYLEFTHIVLFIKHKIRMMSDEGKLYVV